MPERFKPSSPEFAEIDAHMYALNILINPQLFFDAKEGMKDIPDAERDALIEIIKGQIQDVLEE